jgi:hypothetical protein
MNKKIKRGWGKSFKEYPKFNTNSEMKKVMFLMIGLISLVMTSCYGEPTTDRIIAQKTEKTMKEASRQIGMPAIVNFQEKKTLKWIYELCDQENLICHAYLFNETKGEIGKYLGECIGYGVPYSTQFSNPEVYNYDGTTLPQAEPNGLFKPDGMSATWVIMIDPTTKKPGPVYIEPMIIVSPFKLK